MADTGAGAAIDEEPGGTDVGSRSRARWRLPVTLLLIAALVGGAAGLVVRYRHDHTDRYTRDTAAWRGFDVSDDGRTLTFHGWGGSPDAQPDGVTFRSDPTQGGAVTAVFHERYLVWHDGHGMFARASWQFDTPVQSVTFDRPIPEDTVITDGATTFDVGVCAHAVSQPVHAPTTLGGFAPC